MVLLDGWTRPARDYARVEAARGWSGFQTFAWMLFQSCSISGGATPFSDRLKHKDERVVTPVLRIRAEGPRLLHSASRPDTRRARTGFEHRSGHPYQLLINEFTDAQIGELAAVTG